MKKLVIDYGLIYNRIALLEDEKLVEVFVENRFDRSLVGHIYLGRVVNVVPSMAAAFVDIGKKKNAYLPIKDTIKAGQDILVQVKKDPVGEKGAVVTTDISISGHHLVLLPKGDHVMVSKRIRDKEKRQELIDFVESKIDVGAVVRTEAIHASKDVLTKEIDRLLDIWADLKKYTNRIVSDRLIYEDFTFETLIEKEFLAQVDEVILNHKPALKRLVHDKVSFYDDTQPIFQAYGIDEQIKASLSREVKLPQGSFITIDETEALTAVDVNSGQYIGTSNKEATFLQVNLEAAKEIARQLKLRNISGIIILDFINMKEDASYDKLLSTLKKYFKSDKCQPQIHGRTHLGLVEVTRKKNRKSLKTQLFSPCSTCDGSGYVVSIDLVVQRLLDKLRVLKAHTKRDAFVVNVSESFYHVLLDSLQGNTYAGHMENLLEIDLDINIKYDLEGYDFQTTIVNT